LRTLFRLALVAVSIALLAIAALAGAGCGRSTSTSTPTPTASDDHAGHDHGDGHAAAKAAPADWCAEHAVPESKCTRCNPKLVAKFIAAGDYCREHGLPESVCPRCHPDRALAAGGAAPRFPPEGTRVRLASAEAVAAAGIETRRAEVRAVARTLEVVGHLDYDRNRLAQLAAPGDALVLEVRVDVGDDVWKGQPLAVLSSAGVGGQRAALAAARARLDAARAAAEREEALAARGVSARQDAEAARRELAAAQAEHDGARAALAAAGARYGGGGRHVLVAPFDGTVVARDAVAGRTAPSGHVLLEIADLSRMWAQLDIPEAEAARVRPGLPVVVTFDAIPGLRREATLARVGSAIDPASRTLHARAELENRDRALRAGLLVRAELRLTDPRAAVLVPRDAVQHAEGQALVFVRSSPIAFLPVPVRLGEASGDAVAVEGIQGGDEVVTTGAFLLKTEILKDSIGAGCCESERPE